jgi:hypothetical protein
MAKFGKSAILPILQSCTQISEQYLRIKTRIDNFGFLNEYPAACCADKGHPHQT